VNLSLRSRLGRFFFPTFTWMRSGSNTRNQFAGALVPRMSPAPCHAVTLLQVLCRAIRHGCEKCVSPGFRSVLQQARFD